MRKISITTDIARALKHGPRSVVAIGVSGGKDSTAVALATVAYLRSIDYEGRIVLIHADLGRVEWNQSLPKCEELAEHLDLELIVVRRKAGGMLERWQGRWEANAGRYERLECVKTILPWSTASMRFCTSELKTSPICSELKKRFRGHVIINVVGIRRDESVGRSKAPIATRNKALSHKTKDKTTGRATTGYNWNPIVSWMTLDVVESITGAGLPMHEAYTKYGMSRVSCAFCVLSNRCDLRSATLAEENHELYREMVELEITSTFSFQATWLGDVHPEILTPEQRVRLFEAKQKAKQREEIEAEIPDHMLYSKGWPTSIPSLDDAAKLASIRRRVGNLLGLNVQYVTAAAIVDRYAELMDEKPPKAKPDNKPILPLPTKAQMSLFE